MSVAAIKSAHIVGLQAEEVTVEVDVGRGLYSFSIIGLPDKAIDESKDRIIAALKNIGAKNPKTENNKVIVSLSPANIKKRGHILMFLLHLHISWRPNNSPYQKMSDGSLENFLLQEKYSQ